MPKARFRAGVVPVLAGVLLVAGCGTPKVAQDKVEDQIGSQLGKQIGHKPDKVSCPDDLTGKKGKTMKCTLTDKGTKYGVTVKVTSVEGKKVKFDINVDKQPKS